MIKLRASSITCFITFLVQMYDWGLYALINEHEHAYSVITQMMHRCCGDVMH